jgi:hypothetical protein
LPIIKSSVRVPPFIDKNPVECVPSNKSELRLFTTVLEVTLNGGVPAEIEEVNCFAVIFPLVEISPVKVPPVNNKKSLECLPSNKSEFKFVTKVFEIIENGGVPIATEEVNCLAFIVPLDDILG